MDFTVVLIGAGNMGGAMLRGWIAGGMPPSNITVVDPRPSQDMTDFLSAHAIELAADAYGVDAPDVLLLAVKPQMMDEVLPKVKSLIGPQTVAVSVAAGTTIAGISGALGTVPVIRSMPNTPSLVGRGITVACPGERGNRCSQGKCGSVVAGDGKT